MSASLSLAMYIAPTQSQPSPKLAKQITYPLAESLEDRFQSLSKQVQELATRNFAVEQLLQTVRTQLGQRDAEIAKLKRL
jgi:hypothetical protein